jgi:orotidine-5'-phosphate decarboxylase
MAKSFGHGLGIVPALDVDSAEQLDRIVRETSRVEGVAGYKIGLTSVLRAGLAESVRRLRELTDLPLLYDHQKAGPDMPDMAAKFTQLCKDAGADGLILFPVAGPTAVDRFVGEAIKAGLIPVVGGEIPVADYTIAGGGYMKADTLSLIMKRAVKQGASHFVLPARDNEKVKRWARWIGDHVHAPTVFLTGFGALGGSIKEAFAAASPCPDAFAIVGRLITGSKKPGDAARRLFDELRSSRAAQPVL